MGRTSRLKQPEDLSKSGPALQEAHRLIVANGNREIATSMLEPCEDSHCTLARMALRFALGSSPVSLDPLFLRFTAALASLIIVPRRVKTAPAM